MCAIVFQSKSSHFKEFKVHVAFFHDLMAYNAIDSGQVDLQTQQGYSKYGPVAFTSLINEFKTHRCGFDFYYWYKFVQSVIMMIDDVSFPVASIIIPSKYSSIFSYKMFM